MCMEGIDEVLVQADFGCRGCTIHVFMPDLCDTNAVPFPSRSLLGKKKLKVDTIVFRT